MSDILDVTRFRRAEVLAVIQRHREDAESLYEHFKANGTPRQIAFADGQRDACRRLLEAFALSPPEPTYAPIPIPVQRAK